jgi:hypothetical protein
MLLQIQESAKVESLRLRNVRGPLKVNLAVLAMVSLILNTKVRVQRNCLTELLQVRFCAQPSRAAVPNRWVARDGYLAYLNRRKTLESLSLDPRHRKTLERSSVKS